MAPFVLLIQPWIYDFAAYDLWIRPLGLLIIASILRRAGCGVHLIDCLCTDHPDMRQLPGVRQPVRRENGRGHLYRQLIETPLCFAGIKRKYSRYGLHPEIFLKELRTVPRPDAILVSSMMTYWYPAVADCIRLVKETFPDSPVFLGGVYATLCTNHARSHTGADLVLPGPFCRNILLEIERAVGVHLLDDSCDLYLHPDCSLLHCHRAIPVLTSVGCPFRCPYCASSLLHPNFIPKAPSGVVDFIRYWHERGATDFVFFDDALLVNADVHFVPMLQKIQKLNIHVRFHAPNGLHVRYIDDRIASLMKESGFTTLRLSLETIDPDIQQHIGIKVSEQVFALAISSLKRAGFTAENIGVYILAGLPFQKASSVEYTIEFVKSFGLKPMIAEYSPIPGTPLWAEAVRCSPFPIAQEPLFHNNSILPCRWDGFTPEDLIRLKRIARDSTHSECVESLSE